jgi:excisionase family DNA binding protein
MKTEMTPVSGLDPLLSIEDLAEDLGVPVATIYDWRVDGKGPCGVRVGRHVKFTVTDVLAWDSTTGEVSMGCWTNRGLSDGTGADTSSTSRLGDQGSP